VSECVCVCVCVCVGEWVSEFPYLVVWHCNMYYISPRQDWLRVEHHSTLGKWWNGLETMFVRIMSVI